MIAVTYKTGINAPVSTVYDVMLGLTNKSTYEAWTALFNPTSTFEGNWQKGTKMQFVGTDENGEKGGMLSFIDENIPNQFVSIRHIGMIQGGVEITEGPEVENWAGVYENYTFKEENGVTEVAVELETAEEYTEYMDQTYPKALARLKEICEK